MIKELFDVFDLNHDHKLDFSEFILFNLLTNDGSLHEKLEIICGLYSKEKEKYVSRNEIKGLLRNMFDLFDIPTSKLNVIKVIDFIFKRNNINKDEKINWHQFTKEILNSEFLFQQLISSEFQSDNQVIQRSERFLNFIWDSFVLKIIDYHF